MQEPNKETIETFGKTDKNDDLIEFDSLDSALKGIDDIVADVEEEELNKFIELFNFVQNLAHISMKEKGFWDNERNEGEMIALHHSELSEALEALRHGNPPDDKIPEFNGVESELADTFLRIMDHAQGKGHRVAEALVAKLKMNRTRSRMNGGKKF